MPEFEVAIELQQQLLSQLSENEQVQKVIIKRKYLTSGIR